MRDEDLHKIYRADHRDFLQKRTNLKTARKFL